MAAGKRIEYWKSERDGAFYFHVRARNGKVTSPSEGYTQSGSALRQARRDNPGVPSVRIDDPNRRKRRVSEAYPASAVH